MPPLTQIEADFNLFPRNLERRFNDYGIQSKTDENEKRDVVTVERIAENSGPAARRADGTRVVRAVLFAVLVGSLLCVLPVYVGYDMLAESGRPMRPRADYLLMATQCALGVAALALPSLLERWCRMSIPGALQILFVSFLFASIFLGEVRSFYYRFGFWDDILHFTSSAMTALLACLLVPALNRAGSGFPPLFVALFALGFSLAVGVVWEIFEFSFDGVLGLNMQKFMLEGGAELAGRAALADTMWDLVVDTGGALCASAAAYISLRRGRGWICRMVNGAA